MDSAKVTRSAIQNAVSVTDMVLTTERLVTDKKEPATAVLAGGMDDAMSGIY